MSRHSAAHMRYAGRLTGRVSKWVIVVFWVAILAVAGGFAGKLGDVQNNEASSWLPGSAEATRALDKLAPFADSNDIPTIVVYQRSSGLTAADLANGATQAAQLQKLDGVVGKVIGPIPSADKQAMQTIVSFNFGKNGWNELPAAADRIRAIAQSGDGLNVHIAGPGGQAADSAEAFQGLDSTLLFATVGVVILILLVTYRSPVLWLLPVVSAGVALTTAQGVVYLAAKNFDLTVNGQSQGILTVLVFGAGTDYALLLVARYREELRRHEDRHEAMAYALHRAAPAIIASGATVILGMICLLLADLNSTAGLGPVAAIGIGVGLLVMTTLLPALLVVCGRWVFWPKRPAFGSPEPTQSGFWARVGTRIARAPRKVWIVTCALLAVSCLGFLSLDVRALTTAESYTKTFDSVTGQQVLVDHKLADQSNPLQVVANGDRAADVAAALKGLKGIGEVSQPVVKGGVAYLQAPMTDEVPSQAAFDTVERARTAVHKVAGADALVGGTAAITLDIENASSRDNTVIIPAVLLVVLLVLMVLLRAIVAPVVLIATVVLSFGAALGLSSLLFTYVFGFAGADPSLPLFVFVFLVALGIDYNIFLMTRVREETPARGTRQAALVALGATGGVITSAGVVLAATFLVLGTLPLVAFAEIGVAVALGVLLDTLIVRSVLVTALNLDLGDVIWWPSRLAKRGPAGAPVERSTDDLTGVAPR